MNFIDKNEYLNILEILRGNADLDENYKVLHRFIKNTYNINPLYYSFKNWNSANSKYEYRLDIFLENTADYNKCITGKYQNFNEKMQSEISNFFCSLYNLNENNLFVCFHDFSSIMKVEVNRSAFTEGDILLTEKYKELNIWRIDCCFSGVTVFFEKEEDLENYTKSGICQNICEDYSNVLNKYDEFNCFNNCSNIIFDTKENVDKNFNGSLFYYYR